MTSLCHHHCQHNYQIASFENLCEIDQVVSSDANPVQKAGDNFLKSTISLTETCEDELSRVDHSHEDLFGLSNIDFSECLSEDIQDQSQNTMMCSDYQYKGYCFAGKDCDKLHWLNEGKDFTRKSRSRKHWILNEIPELLMQRSQRLFSFLN